MGAPLPSSSAAAAASGKAPKAPSNETTSSTPNTMTQRNPKKQSSLLLWVGLCCIVSGLFNILHAHWFHISSTHPHDTRVDKKRSIFRRRGGGAVHMAMNEFLKGKDALIQKQRERESHRQTKLMNQAASPAAAEPHPDVAHAQLQQHSMDKHSDSLNAWGDAQHPDTLATLACEAHGGPDAEAAQEMVYWHDIPSDTKYQSPFFMRDGIERFLTFEPGTCQRT